MEITSATPFPEGRAWRIVGLRELSPPAQRGLLESLGLRVWSGPAAEAVFRDLCLCEVGPGEDVNQVLPWLEAHCGARIPVVVLPGPPAGIHFGVRDLGAVAAWYFQALDRLHGRDPLPAEKSGK